MLYKLRKMNSNAFYDLNVPVDSAGNIPHIKDWYRNQYSTIALNHTVDLTEVEDQKKKKKSGVKQDLVVPEPIDIKLPSELAGKIKVLNRLTIKVSEISQLPKIFQAKSSTLKKYDLIAVMPTEQSCLQHVCSMNDVDIISIDCQSKQTWRLTKKLYKVVVDQNKFFELCYGPMIKDKSTLKNTIFMAHTLYTVHNAKNLIVSSSTSDVFFLRTPYEVTHLCFLFGLDENKGRTCVSSSPAGAVNRASKRRLGKSCISITVPS